MSGVTILGMLNVRFVSDCLYMSVVLLQISKAGYISVLQNKWKAVTVQGTAAADIDIKNCTDFVYQDPSESTQQ